MKRFRSASDTYKLWERWLQSLLQHLRRLLPLNYQLIEIHIIPAAPCAICTPFRQLWLPAPLCNKQHDPSGARPSGSKRSGSWVISAWLTGVAAYHTLYFCSAHLCSSPLTPPRLWQSKQPENPRLESELQTGLRNVSSVHFSQFYSDERSTSSELTPKETLNL